MTTAAASGVAGHWHDREAEECTTELELRACTSRASKAGLTQLARVAALEWGSDGIRVNVIHPHAVFDTALWTDEIVETRASVRHECRRVPGQ